MSQPRDDRQDDLFQLPVGAVHQSPPCAGCTRREDRLGLCGETLQLGLSRGAWAAATADAADRRAVHPQAYAQPLRRGAVRSLGREPVLPILLWGSGVPTRAAV